MAQDVEYFRAEDGAKLAYRDQGSGLPLVCLAGLTRDGRDFEVLRPLLPGQRLIRLDARGRGASDRTGAETYTVVQEARDVLALLDHLGLAQVAVIGSSRGGLLGMVLAATGRPRLMGLCLNDVGPALERAGLERIGAYVGLRPTATTHAEMAAQLAQTPGFANVPPSRWLAEAERLFIQADDGLHLPYDPALRDSFATAMAAPPVDLWPLFDLGAGLPLALIRGANSDVLSAATAQEMYRRRPDMIWTEVPDRAHIPFLDEPASVAAISRWLALLTP